MIDRDYRKLKGCVVSVDGFVCWRGKASRLPENWEPSSYWGIGRDEAEAEEAARRYVK